MGFGSVSGNLTTTSATPESVDLFSILPSKSIFITAYIEAVNVSGGIYAGFVRNVSYKNVAGTLSYFDQIQDVYTMRGDDWYVDFTTVGTKVQLRVWGKTSQTINWRFAVSCIPTL